MKKEKLNDDLNIKDQKAVCLEVIKFLNKADFEHRFAMTNTINGFAMAAGIFTSMVLVQFDDLYPNDEREVYDLSVIHEMLDIFNEYFYGGLINAIKLSNSK